MLRCNQRITAVGMIYRPKQVVPGFRRDDAMGGRQPQVGNLILFHDSARRFHDSAAFSTSLPTFNDPADHLCPCQTFHDSAGLPTSLQDPGRPYLLM
jgi:hypothetical protein